MKTLVIGGCGQGKLNYVLQQQNIQGEIGKEQKSAAQENEGRYKLYDGYLPELTGPGDMEIQHTVFIIHHFHMWVRNCLKEQGNPEKMLQEFIKYHLNWIIISDEIGNGIVPMDSFEREYRERTGRMLVWLAKQSEEVVRVLCGIGQKIK